MAGAGKKRIAVTVFILVAVALISAGYALKQKAQWGRTLPYKGCRLFYTSKVTEKEAHRLGEYLLKVGLFRDGESTVAQLTKEGDVYQLRVVTDKEALEKKRPPEEMGPVEAAGLLAEEISKDVFNGAKVEWHLCDDKFRTLRIGGNYQ
ncbi:MAG: hypothetical protein Q8O12_02435 [Candidatus Omnitrophota bacterium]|nr:hypothetical protein [Candidatus Omnitrophota bacterium]